MFEHKSRDEALLFMIFHKFMRKEKKKTLEAGSKGSQQILLFKDSEASTPGRKNRPFLFFIFYFYFIFIFCIVLKIKLFKLWPAGRGCCLPRPQPCQNGSFNPFRLIKMQQKKGQKLGHKKSSNSAKLLFVHFLVKMKPGPSSARSSVNRSATV